jgi:hypothetical protein
MKYKIHSQNKEAITYQAMTEEYFETIPVPRDLIEQIKEGKFEK